MNYNGHDIKVVWVDLDDTIIDFTANARASLTIMYDNEPLLRQLYPSEALWAETYERHNMTLWAKYNVGIIKRDFLRMERFRLPLTEAGLPDAEARTVSKRFDTLYLDLLARQKRLVPRAMELLTVLRTKKVTIGVLSNGFREVQFRKIDSAGLTPYIDTVVLSDDIGINKPDTRIFIHAMKRTADADPTHHLLIGDNLQTDISGAINAGWSAIWLNRTTVTAPSPACPDTAVEVHNLYDIIPLLIL